MNITQVKIFPVEEEKLKAFVSVVFDHCFMVNDIKVIQGKDGLFLSMPSRRKKSGEFKDVAHPLNNETRRRIEETVLREYRAVVDDATPRRPDRTDDESEADASDAEGSEAASEAPSGAGEARRSGNMPLGAPGADHPVPPPMTGAGSNGSARPELPPLQAETKPGTDQVAVRDAGPAPPAADTAFAAERTETQSGEGQGKAEDGDDEAGEPTLEEVQEMHLSDSFWTVS